MFAGTLFARSETHIRAQNVYFLSPDVVGGGT